MIKFVLFKIRIFVLLEHFIQFVYFDILKKIIKTYFPNGVTCGSSFTVWNLWNQGRHCADCGHFIDISLLAKYQASFGTFKHTNPQCLIFQVCSFLFNATSRILRALVPFLTRRMWSQI